jgi:hypothetical protein
LQQQLQAQPQGEETMTEIRDVYSRITGKIIADKAWNADHAAGRITLTKGYACPLWLTSHGRLNAPRWRRNLAAHSKHPDRSIALTDDVCPRRRGRDG